MCHVRTRLGILLRLSLVRDLEVTIGGPEVLMFNKWCAWVTNVPDLLSVRRLVSNTLVVMTLVKYNVIVSSILLIAYTQNITLISTLNHI